MKKLVEITKSSQCPHRFVCTCWYDDEHNPCSTDNIPTYCPLPDAGDEDE